MTQNEFNQIWDENLIGANLDLFGRDLEKSLNVYFDSLKFLTVSDLKAVIKKYLQYNQKFPTIKQLLEIYKAREWKEKHEVKHDKDGYRIVECSKCDDIGLIPMRKLERSETYMARCVCQKCKNPKIPYAGKLINSGKYVKICDCCKENLEMFKTDKYCLECKNKYYSKEIK